MSLFNFAPLHVFFCIDFMQLRAKNVVKQGKHPKGIHRTFRDAKNMPGMTIIKMRCQTFYHMYARYIRSTKCDARHFCHMYAWYRPVRGLSSKCDAIAWPRSQHAQLLRGPPDEPKVLVRFSCYTLKPSYFPHCQQEILKKTDHQHVEHGLLVVDQVMLICIMLNLC